MPDSCFEGDRQRMVVDCMDEIIIWGAGKVAVKRLEWAAFAGYQVLFFIDNDTAKWERELGEFQSVLLKY